MTQNQNEPTKFVAVPLSLLQAVISYLESRPYGEVAQGVDGLKQCNFVQEQPTNADPASTHVDREGVDPGVGEPAYTGNSEGTPVPAA